MMDEPAAETTNTAPMRRLTSRQIVLQVAGFIVGSALLAWCITVASRGADWSLVVNADRRLVIGLLATTLASLVVNAGMFWCVLRPVYRHSVPKLTLLNAVAGLFNYSPIRLGLVLRIAYHLRVDPLRASTIAAWMLATAGIMFVALGAATVGGAFAMPSVTATLVLTLAVLAAAHGALALAFRLPPVAAGASRLDGLRPMLLTPWSYWATALLRLLDILCFMVRMWFAARILELEISSTDLLLLALAAQVVSLSPVGRLGFREAAVAFLATRLESGLDSSGIDATFTQLALIESAGEAAVLLPAGLIALPWYLRSMRRAHGVSALSSPRHASTPWR